MRRFDPPYVALRDRVVGGEIGAPLIAHCVSRTVHTYPGGDSASSITQSAIHELDIVPWLLDSPIVEVSWQHGRSSVNSGGRQDPQFYLMRTASDVLVTVELFLNARYGYDTRCEVVMEAGNLRADLADSHRHRRRKHEGPSRIPRTGSRATATPIASSSRNGSTRSPRAGRRRWPPHTMACALLWLPMRLSSRCVPTAPGSRCPTELEHRQRRLGGELDGFAHRKRAERDDRISTPHGPSKPLSRKSATKPRRSKEPSPHSSRWFTVSSNMRADHSGRGVVELDAEDHFGRQGRPQLVERRAGPEHVPGVHQQPDAGMCGCRDDFGAHRHRRDDRERHRLDGDPGAVFGCLRGEFAQRFDQRLGIGVRWSQFGADLDERRRQRVGRVEQQVANVVGVVRARREGSTTARSVRSRRG